MIIMKRMVFSLNVERTPYQGRYFYIGAWTALGPKCCEWRVRGAALLTRRTGGARIDTFFEKLWRSAPGDRRKVSWWETKSQFLIVLRLSQWLLMLKYLQVETEGV
jgi:hypothetical protein